MRGCIVVLTVNSYHAVHQWSIDDTRSVCRCGSAEGLDAGRHCLQQWGFRRCEDICWIKTNKEQRKAASVRQDAQAVLQHTKVSIAAFARTYWLGQRGFSE